MQDAWDEMHGQLQALTEKGSRRIAEHRAELAGQSGCVECGRLIADDGRWYSDGIGGLVPYCKACADRASCPLGQAVDETLSDGLLDGGGLTPDKVRPLRA